MKRSKIKDLLAGVGLGEKVTTMGWVRTFRNDMFIALNDGSTVKNLQCVVKENSGLKLYAGTCIAVTGSLIESQGRRSNHTRRGRPTVISTTTQRTFVGVFT